MKRQGDTFETAARYRRQWTDGSRNILRGARGGTHDLARLRKILTEVYDSATADANFAPRDLAAPSSSAS